MAAPSEMNVNPDELPFIRALQGSLARNAALSFAHYAQMATVDLQGNPAVRTVVVRGFHQTNNLIVTTDSRSPKLREISSHPDHIVELCWFFPLTNEQFRIRCSVSVVDSSAPENSELASLRSEHWKKLPPSTRALFEEPAPSTPTRSPHQLQQQLGDLDKYEAQPVHPTRPSTNFSLLLLKPLRVDHLMLPPPQADPSKPVHRESLLQPARKAKRFLHQFEPTTSAWTVVELNA